MQLDRSIAPAVQPISDLLITEAVAREVMPGFVTHVINSGTQEACKVELIFNAGARFQEISLQASLTADMLLNGTASKPGKQIVEEIDHYGAFFETHSGSDRMTVVLYSLNKHLPKVLGLLLDAIEGANFPQNEFEVARNRALQKFQVNHERVDYLARKQFNRLIFPDHVYGSFAELRDFEEITRNHLVAHHRQHILKGEVDVIIAGRVDDNLIDQLAPVLRNRSFSANLGSLPEAPLSAQSSESSYVEKPGAVQSAIEIGTQLFSRSHSDFVGMQVLSTILGGYFGSRLMANIREDKGYTYGIHSVLQPRHKCGAFAIITQVGARVCDGALTEIYKEIERLQQELVDQQELDLVRNYMLGRMLKNFDGPFAQANCFKSIYYDGLDYNYFRNYISTVKSIAPEQIQALAVKYLQLDSLIEVVAGPKRATQS